MFFRRGSLVLLLLAALAANFASASLIVFGDSYSDVGIAGHGIHQVIHTALSTPQLDVGTFPLAPYRDGRLSNGLIWTEVAATNLGLELESFATANAGSGAVPTQLYIPPPFGGQTTEGEFQIPNTLQQAQAYLALKAGVMMPADIVLIFIGTNDYMFSEPPGNYTQPPVNQVIAAIIQTMDMCYHAGARRFVLVNVPPLWTLPALPGPNPFGPGTTLQAEAMSNDWFKQCVPGHNAALAGVANGYANYNPNSTVLYYDLFEFWSEVVENPHAYGFQDAVNPCLGQSQNANLAYGYNNTVCAQPDNYVYWDLVHPSKHFHAEIANDFLSRLGPVLNSL